MAGVLKGWKVLVAVKASLPSLSIGVKGGSVGGFRMPSMSRHVIEEELSRYISPIKELTGVVVAAAASEDL
jgi:hypothetical protein